MFIVKLHYNIDQIQGCLFLMKQNEHVASLSNMNINEKFLLLLNTDILQFTNQLF